MSSDPRRRIPGLDELLETPAFRDLLERFARERVVEHLREAQKRVRQRLAADAGALDPEAPETYAGLVESSLAGEEEASLRPVINATGVVLHTNLGRAPLAREAREAMSRAARGYSNLEFDLETGSRGSRYDHCVALLRKLTGAEDALVVNNNAGALVLALNTLARARAVVVSRGELVEIGGGFRIPEMLERAGARLREVGTTNRTRLSDYEEALEAGEAGAVLKVHRSNFRVEGFTEEAPLAELAELARAKGVSLVHDLGSGLFLAPERLGLPYEPRAAESLERGADVVAVSGDKLLGGPQAGILAGRSEVVGAMRGNPLCRALRVDKVTLAGLEATLRLYLEPGRAAADIPALRMLGGRPAELHERAEVLARALTERGIRVSVLQDVSLVGGGTYPGLELPTWTLRLEPPGADAEGLASRLRRGHRPVVGRVEGERVVLDLRTVDPDEEEELLRRIREAWTEA